MTKPVTDQLDAVNIEWQIFDEVEPEPSLDTIKKGGVAVGKYQPDWVIGIGGGSCMDAAKAIILLLARPELEPEALSVLEDFQFPGKGQVDGHSHHQRNGLGSYLGNRAHRHKG